MWYNSYVFAIIGIRYICALRRLSGAADTDSPSKNGDKTVPVSASLKLMCFSRALLTAYNAHMVEHIGS